MSCVLSGRPVWQPAHSLPHTAPTNTEIHQLVQPANSNISPLWLMVWWIILQYIVQGNDTNWEEIMKTCWNKSMRYTETPATSWATNWMSLSEMWLKVNKWVSAGCIMIQLHNNSQAACTTATCSCNSVTHHVEQLWTLNRDEVKAWLIGHSLSGDNTETHNETMSSFTLSLYIQTLTCKSTKIYLHILLTQILGIAAKTFVSNFLFWTVILSPPGVRECRAVLT